MKKIFLALLVVLLTVVPVFAGTIVWEKNSSSYWTGDLLSAPTVTGAATSQSLKTALDKYTCQTVVTGQTPTTTTVTIQGSIDGTNYFTVDTHVVTGLTTSITSTVSKPSLHLRGSWVFTSASSTLPTVHTKCLAAH